ncbi:MAG: T9SS type A sorting domain-containing protein [Flavobacteriales bacterium]|nr:T9SS type A sorting domain-containing protein [Flavobacteriales bacterium]MCB9192837.1 T9SS type A sorting domain-containing protein [Flavobacteriales bacterium]
MRLLLALITFSFISHGTCFAQVDWAPIGAKWWYGYTIYSPASPDFIVSYYTMESVDTVVIQNKTCKQLEFEPDGQECYACGSLPLYVYSDSGQVYFFNHDLNDFALLYDMNLEIGESWGVHFTNWFEEDSIVLTVTDTMSTIVNGIRLRQQVVNFSYEYLFGDTITEGLGGAMTFFPNCANFGGYCEANYQGLRCYEDGLLGLYHNTPDDCEYEFIFIGIEEQNFQFSIYPNPATYNLRIESQTPLAQVKLTDLAGRPLVHHPLSAAGTQDDPITIDISGLPSGIYLLEAITQNGKRSVQKVVVE